MAKPEYSLVTIPEIAANYTPSTSSMADVPGLVPSIEAFMHGNMRPMNQRLQTLRHEQMYTPILMYLYREIKTNNVPALFRVNFPTQ